MKEKREKEIKNRRCVLFVYGQELRTSHYKSRAKYLITDDDNKFQ